MTYILPIKITGEYSLNKIYAGIHWRKRQKQAEFIHAIVKSEVCKNKPLGTFENPVEINFYYPKGRIDIDNYGYLDKLIIDGLKGLVITDDSPKYLRKISKTFWSGNGVKIEINEANSLTAIPIGQGGA